MDSCNVDTTVINDNATEFLSIGALSAPLSHKACVCFSCSLKRCGRSTHTNSMKSALVRGAQFY